MHIPLRDQSPKLIAETSEIGVDPQETCRKGKPESSRFRSADVDVILPDANERLHEMGEPRGADPVGVGYENDRLPRSTHGRFRVSGGFDRCRRRIPLHAIAVGGLSSGEDAVKIGDEGRGQLAVPC
ncbi:hypothetical protein BHE74_00018152 [Ensete ventricosum]|nr:hypothetical protein GW17_00007804 [Ensete ventricosum]RWW73928.1 hypothetical protein BHE74_00018152 [Ensete ventricosum]RZR81911.1 hypothetical protein BHM03_00008218 [Ensete ventricosum]